MAAAHREPRRGGGQERHSAALWHRSRRGQRGGRGLLTALEMGRSGSREDLKMGRLSALEMGPLRQNRHPSSGRMLVGQRTTWVPPITTPTSARRKVAAATESGVNGAGDGKRVRTATVGVVPFQDVLNDDQRDSSNSCSTDSGPEARGSPKDPPSSPVAVAGAGDAGVAACHARAELGRLRR